MPLQFSPPGSASQDVEASPSQLVVSPGWKGWLSSSLVWVEACWAWAGSKEAPPLPAAVTPPLLAAHYLLPRTQGSVLFAACDSDDVAASSLARHQLKRCWRGVEPWAVPSSAWAAALAPAKCSGCPAAVMNQVRESDHYEMNDHSDDAQDVQLERKRWDSD